MNTQFDSFFKYDYHEIKEHILTLYNVNFIKTLDCVYKKEELDLEYPYLCVYNKDKHNYNIGTIVTIDMNTLIWEASFPCDKDNIVCYGGFVYKNDKIVSKWHHLNKKKKRNLKCLYLSIIFGIFALKLKKKLSKTST